MKQHSILIGLAATLVGMIISTTAAFAAPATAKSPVNVRTGPGVNYNRVDTLTQNEQVNVTECRGNWCYIEHEGPDGWVSGNYLNQNVQVVQPTQQPNVSVTVGGPNFSVTIGNRQPKPVPVLPKVCFFNGPNFTGNSACVNAGTSDNKLTGYWNDKVSSVRVQPGTTVTLCRNYYYNGFCQTYHSSVPSLNGFLNNQVSSYATAR